MFNKTTFTFLLFLWVLNQSFAQQEPLSRCGTIEKTDAEMEALPWYGNGAYLDQIRISRSSMLTGNTSVQDRDVSECPDIDAPFLLPIRFWIYRETDTETGLPNARELQVSVDALTSLYRSNGMNVRFFMVCPQYETNTNLTQATDWETFWNVFSGSNTDADAINVHVVKEYLSGGAVYNAGADIIVIPRAVLQVPNRISTLAHEVGHFFQLEHTHRNSTKGKCYAEAVSRTRHFTNNQLFCLPPRTGLICEKTGDLLCSTPADPNLVWEAFNPPPSKVGSNCKYNWAEIDNWGDAYVPDETNIMSYAPPPCRSFFSSGQVSIMAENMQIGRNSVFDILDLNETDPDKYEPDDSDFPGVPRAIVLGEVQCHSFYEISECQDPADWLIMSLSQGVLGSYQVKIDGVDGGNPVESVRVWNMGSDLMRSTEVSTTLSTVGATRIYSFPCVNPTDKSYLLEVVRKSDVHEGLYKITLTSDTPLSISGNNLLCNNLSYTVGTLPAGATVNWQSSLNITLGNTSGATTSIQSFNGNSALPYWIQATVSSGSCSQKIRKTFSYVGVGGVPDFIILEKSAACFPGDGEYYISNPIGGITYTWSCTGSPCGNVQSVGNGEAAYIEPYGMGSMTIVVIATDGCGNSRTKTKVVQVNKCQHMMGGIIVTPNPSSTGSINVTVQDTYDTDGTYQVFITNQSSEVKYQSDKFTKQFDIDLSAQPNGMYYIHIYREDISGSAAFVINKGG